MLIHAAVILMTATVKIRGCNDKFNNKILFLPEGVKSFCVGSISQMAQGPSQGEM